MIYEHSKREPRYRGAVTNQYIEKEVDRLAAFQLEWETVYEVTLMGSFYAYGYCRYSDDGSGPGGRCFL